jgi:hypothetical protein
MDGTFQTEEKAAEFHNRVHCRKPSDKDHKSFYYHPSQAAGNLATQRLLCSGVIQPKLAISQPDDVQEEEVDRIDEQVMRMAEPGLLQRRCSACEIGATCSSCEKKNSLLRRKAGQRNSWPDNNHAAEGFVSALGAGRPLDTATRDFFENRFGADLSDVRVHTDRGAANSAESINALAYTLGRDVVFAPGQYTPETMEGRRLLAHELTHVVQQAKAQPSSLGIQRRLRVTGKRTDIKAFIDLLEPASGFTLKYDLKTNEVSIVASRLKPPSFVLASRLATIMDDPHQDAELNLGRRQPAVGFGAFPFSGPLIQEIDIDDFQRLEAKAPGSGIALLIHEIVENYHAHGPGLRDFDRHVVFGESHKEALEAERMVAEELVGRPGGRVGRAVAAIGSDVVRNVDDYENYFLVVDYRRGILTAARQVPRVNVSKYTIGGFAAGSVVMPAAAQPTISAVVDDLVANPTATVLIESGDPDPDLALRRAEEIQAVILSAGKGRKGFDLRSWRNFNLVGFAKAGAGGPVIVTVDRPDTEAEAERGRLVKRVLRSASPRQ